MITLVTFVIASQMGFLPAFNQTTTKCFCTFVAFILGECGQQGYIAIVLLHPTPFRTHSETIPCWYGLYWVPAQFTYNSTGPSIKVLEEHCVPIQLKELVLFTIHLSEVLNRRCSQYIWFQKDNKSFLFVSLLYMDYLFCSAFVQSLTQASWYMSQCLKTPVQH